MNLKNHPCFNDKKRHIYARVHLPVAPKCNIQCNYCVRKYDCVNESKPGVTSEILTPEQSLNYLSKVMKNMGNISVVGIAGPGDPFSNPEETMKTLRLVRNKYSNMLLCVATNGLNIIPYIDELSELNITHVTLTVNAIDPVIGAKIYSWVRDDKKIYHKEEAANLLISKQLEAIRKLKEKNIMVKVNTIIIPGVNDKHISEVALKVKEIGADIINCIPMITNKGSVFENIENPDKSMIDNIREVVSKIMPQMNHCNRCRADAVGLIGDKMTDSDFELLRFASGNINDHIDKGNIAIGTREGILINQHLGEIDYVYVYSKDGDRARLIDRRKAPLPGGGDNRWHEFADIIKDCSVIMVSGAGGNPEKIFSEYGIRIIKTEGVIDIVINRFFSGKKIIEIINDGCIKGLGCTGTGNGCG